MAFEVSANSKQKALFASFDKNQDQKISKEEWLSHYLKDFTNSDPAVAAQMAAIKKQMEAAFSKSFEETDKNKDGYIVKDEMFN